MHPSRLRKFFRWFYRNRSLTLTPEGTRFVVLAIAIGLAAVNTGNNLLYLLLAMMLSLIILSGILSEQCLKRLTIRRRLPAHMFAGRPATAYFSITNNKSRLPSFSIRVMDVIDDQPIDRGIHLHHLGPGATSLQPYPLLIPRRGRYGVDGIKILTRFPFNLFAKGLTVPLESDAVVYPAIKALPSVLHDEMVAFGHDQQVQKRGQGSDLYNLRLYQPGDDSRAIHWRTTARTNLLIVRETEAEDQRRVFLMLPTTLPETTGAEGLLAPDLENNFERAVELAASLAAHFQEGGFAIRALVGDQEVPDGAGEGHFYRILRALALCHPTRSGDSEPAPTSPWNLGRSTSGNELTILILPWDDPQLESRWAGVTRMIRISELRDL